MILPTLFHIVGELDLLVREDNFEIETYLISNIQYNH